MLIELSGLLGLGCTTVKILRVVLGYFIVIGVAWVNRDVVVISDTRVPCVARIITMISLILS